MPSTDHEPLTLTLFLHKERDDWIVVSDDGERCNACTLPKNRIEIEYTDKPNIIEVTMPEWLALDRELV